jgi:hypothetical protein
VDDCSLNLARHNYAARRACRCLVYALEDFDPAGQRAAKAAIFTHRVVAPRAPRLGADTAADALVSDLTHRDLSQAMLDYYLPGRARIRDLARPGGPLGSRLAAEKMFTFGLGG